MKENVEPLVEQYDPYKDGGVRLKQLLAGSKFIYRDTNLSKDQLSKFQVGMFFKEHTACDATAKFGGINGNVRFLIVTSTPKDLSVLSPNPSFAHSVVGMNEVYKVIAVSEKQGYFQITVLHVPNEFRSYFSSQDAQGFEGLVLQSTEQDFNEACTVPVDPDLEHPDWVERVKPPIGLDNNHEPIPA